MKRTLTRKTAVRVTPLDIQVCGMFDLDPETPIERTWDVDVTLPAEWSVGVIVGPSMAGKSTLARELFGEQLVGEWDWPADQSLLNGFPSGLSVKEITTLLSSVGLSSPPDWRKPFAALSNG